MNCSVTATGDDRVAAALHRFLGQDYASARSVAYQRLGIDAPGTKHFESFLNCLFAACGILARCWIVDQCKATHRKVTPPDELALSCAAGPNFSILADNHLPPDFSCAKQAATILDVSKSANGVIY